jgi:hypothetical protein
MLVARSSTLLLTTLVLPFSRVFRATPWHGISIEGRTGVAKGGCFGVMGRSSVCREWAFAGGSVSEEIGRAGLHPRSDARCAAMGMVDEVGWHTVSPGPASIQELPRQSLGLGRVGAQPEAKV